VGPEVIGEGEETDEQNEVECNDEESFDVVLRGRHSGNLRPKKEFVDKVFAGAGIFCSGSARVSPAGWKARPCAVALRYGGVSPKQSFPDQVREDETSSPALETSALPGHCRFTPLWNRTFCD
jgi:hypothetical protein